VILSDTWLSILSDVIQCDPLTCPRNKQYQNIGLDAQHGSKTENSNANSDCNARSGGSDYFDMRNSNLTKSSCSQVSSELKGTMKGASSEVMLKQIREKHITAKSPAYSLGFGDDYHAQDALDDFNEIVPAWLMDPVADMDVQNSAATPRICETSLNRWGFTGITHFDDDWLDLATMGSDMARATDMDTSMNYQPDDSIIPEPRFTERSWTGTHSFIAPHSSLSPGMWASSSSEPVSTSMTSFETINEIDGDDDRAPVSVGVKIGHVEKDIPGASDGSRDVVTVENPKPYSGHSHIQLNSQTEVTQQQVNWNDNLFGKRLRCEAFRGPRGVPKKPYATIQHLKRSRIQFPEPSETKGVGSDQLPATTDLGVLAKTRKVPEFGEGVENGIEVTDEVIIEPVSDHGEMLAVENSNHPTPTAVVERHNLNMGRDLDNHGYVKSRPPLPPAKLGLGKDEDRTLPEIEWQSAMGLREDFYEPAPDPRPSISYLCSPESGNDSTKGNQDFSKPANSALESVSEGDAGRDKPRAISMADVRPKELVYFLIVETFLPILNVVIIT
jgi:hypothetical protein